MFINLRKRMKCQKGFTLIELMVVISIIGLLAAIAVPRYSSASDSAHGGKVQGDLLSIDTAIQMAIAQGHKITETNDFSNNLAVAANMNSIPTPECIRFKVGTIDYTGVAVNATYKIIIDRAGVPRAAIDATAGIGATTTSPFTATTLGR